MIKFSIKCSLVPFHSWYKWLYSWYNDFQIKNRVYALKYCMHGIIKWRLYLVIMGNLIFWMIIRFSICCISMWPKIHDFHSLFKLYFTSSLMLHILKLGFKVSLRRAMLHILKLDFEVSRRRAIYLLHFANSIYIRNHRWPRVFHNDISNVMSNKTKYMWRNGVRLTTKLPI